MRRLLALIAIASSALGLVVATGTAGAAVSRDHPPTQITVIRPVNAAGFARPNFTVVGVTGSVDCSFADPSPGAVSPNIENCSPTAAGAFACWKAAAAHKLLCLRNVRARKLTRIHRMGAFAPTGLAPVLQRAPLAVALANGDYCTLRTGGTGAIRQGHPRWVETYFCNSGKFLWQRPATNHYGINEQFDAWIAVEAGASGPIFARYVLRAWFVGTYHGG